MNDVAGGGTTREYAGGKMLATKNDGVGLITFNQPSKRNAISLEMWTGFGEILSWRGRFPHPARGERRQAHHLGRQCFRQRR